MRTLLITIVCLLLLLGGAGSVAASGFLDEMILSSEWWAGKNSRARLKFSYWYIRVGKHRHQLSFSLRQDVDKVNFAVNGALGLDQRMFLNGPLNLVNPTYIMGLCGLFWWPRVINLSFYPG